MKVIENKKTIPWLHFFWLNGKLYKHNFKTGKTTHLRT